MPAIHVLYVLPILDHRSQFNEFCWPIFEELFDSR